MMQQLRESTKIIMIVVSIAFVGLMVFEWGMDYSGTSTGVGTRTRLGSVDGADISIDDYQNQYRLLYDQAQRQALDGQLSSEELRQIEQQAWDNSVDQTLLNREAARRHIGLTDTEIVEYIRANPPQDLIGLPAFQTNGQFDPQKYEAALGDPALAATWAAYEEQIRRSLPLQRLQEQIVAGVTVSDAELVETFRAQNERARIEYLALQPERLIPDAEAPVTEEEIAQRYEEVRERFRRDPSAQIEYVAVEPETTAADSAAVAAEADSLAIVAADPATDFSELARDESDDALTRDNGGELGWFEPSTMAPAFAEAIADLSPGDVSGPVLTEFGWHIIKVEDELEPDDEAHRIRARHILLTIEPSQGARDAARDLAREVAQATSGGDLSFAEAAAERDLEVESPPVFEQGLVIPGVGSAPILTEFVFANDPGAVSGVLEHGGVYYVVHVIERYQAGYIALEQVASELREEISKEKKFAAVRAMAPEVQATVRDRGLAGAAEALGLEIRTTDWFTRLNNIPGIGSGTPVAGAAFGLSQGQTAGPIEASTGLYFIRLIEKQPYDVDAFERERESLQNQLRLAKMRSRFRDWFDHLREEADVEDNRAQILGTT